MNTNPVALKEWDSTVNVLAEGKQIILLRKGGIKEETRRFELKSDSFYLFPTYEHQRPELAKETYRHYVEQSLAGFVANAPMIKLTVYAEAVADFEVRSLEQLEKLLPYHMWSEGLAEDRLRWKAKEPLHVLLLRVYILDEPAEIPVLPEYSGCRSWVELIPPPNSQPMTPVLNNEEFQLRCEEIRMALEKE